MEQLKRLALGVLLVAMLSASAFAYTFESESAADIAGPSDWAKTEIEQAQAAGLVTEHTNMNFKHDITRFQFAELILNMVEKATGKTIEAAPDTAFTDCKEVAVLKANAAGIVDGVGDGLFDPDRTTNREQIAAMVTRAIDYIDAQTGSDLAPAAPDIEKFSDKGQVSAWAADGMGTLAANGMMAGTSDTTLSPKDPCTVEQSILLVYRVYQQTQN